MNNPLIKDRECHLLIVEDEELIAMNLEIMLTKMGYHIAGNVTNADDAIDIVSKKHIDLLLMDVIIQGNYDGIELVGLIQEQKDIPVIFMTAQEDEMSFKRALRFEPDAYLLKPVSEIQLKRSIELALSRIDEQSSEIITPGTKSKEIEEHFFIRKKQQIHRIHPDDILYLRTDGKYCRLYTSTDLFLIRKSLKETSLAIKSNYLHQCHRAYMVNLLKIESVNLEDEFLIIGEDSIPISRRERKLLLDKLNFLQ